MLARRVMFLSTDEHIQQFKSRRYVRRLFYFSVGYSRSEAGRAGRQQDAQDARRLYGKNTIQFFRLARRFYPIDAKRSAQDAPSEARRTRQAFLVVGSFLV